MQYFNNRISKTLVKEHLWHKAHQRYPYWWFYFGSPTYAHGAFNLVTERQKLRATYLMVASNTWTVESLSNETVSITNFTAFWNSEEFPITFYTRKKYIKSNYCFRRGETIEWPVHILDQQSYALDPEHVLQAPGNKLFRKLTIPLTWKTVFKYKYIMLKQGNPDIFLSFSQVYALSFTQRHHCGWSLSPWA